MTDLRTHWMRTVHEALCGLSAKRLMLGERIIGGECATADVTCHGCRAVLRLAAMDAASGGPDDLRTLAQAVVDTDDAHRAAVKAMRENRTSELELAMYRTDIARKRASNDAGMSVADARRILTALDAERDAAATSGDARGYARAMGEVEARCEAEAAGACPGDDAHGALHAVAEWARERLTAAAEKERE